MEDGEVPAEAARGVSGLRRCDWDVQVGVQQRL